MPIDPISVAAKSVYQKAIEALVQKSNDDGPIFIADDKSVSNLFNSRELAGRKVVLINSTNEKEELIKNGNLIRSYEIEYPLINQDWLQIKISHNVIYEIDILKSESEWPEKLSSRERELTREGVAKCRLLNGDDVKTYSAFIQNAWTYVTFRFDSTFQGFQD